MLRLHIAACYVCTKAYVVKKMAAEKAKTEREKKYSGLYQKKQRQKPVKKTKVVY